MNYLSIACLATFTFMLSNNSWCIIYVFCVLTHHQSCDYHLPLKGILLWNISCWVFRTVLFHRCSLDSYLAIYNLLPDISLQPHISQPHHDYDCSCFSRKRKHTDDWNVIHIFFNGVWLPIITYHRYREHGIWTHAIIPAPFYLDTDLNKHIAYILLIPTIWYSFRVTGPFVGRSSVYSSHTMQFDFDDRLFLVWSEYIMGQTVGMLVIGDTLTTM